MGAAAVGTARLVCAVLRAECPDVDIIRRRVQGGRRQPLPACRPDDDPDAHKRDVPPGFRTTSITSALILRH